MSQTLFIQHSRHRTVYYFRRRVPRGLKPLLKRQQITATLRTTSRCIAIVRARYLAAQTDVLFSRLRSMNRKSRDCDGDDELRSDFNFKLVLDDGTEFRVSSDPGDDADRAVAEALADRTVAALARSGRVPPPLPLLSALTTLPYSFLRLGTSDQRHSRATVPSQRMQSSFSGHRQTCSRSI